jgi:hypothetical protein
MAVLETGGGTITARRSERDALVLWANSPPEERAKAYADNHFGIPADRMPKAITEKFKSADAVRVKDIIDTRCVRCHGGDVKPENRFENYETLKKFLDPKAAAN